MIRKLKTIFDAMMRRHAGELSPRDQARLRLASELGPKKPPSTYQGPQPTPWYDRALERVRRDGS